MPVTRFGSRWFRVFSLLLGLAFGGLLATAPAYAFGLPFHSSKWYMKHMYYRIGVGEMKYAGSSEPISFQNPPPVTSLSVKPGPVAGSGAHISDDTTLSGMLGFILPHTGRHLSLEVQLAPPLHFKFYTEGTAANESLAPTALGGLLKTGVPATGPMIGRFKALPPNFTFVYRPWLDTIVRPYVGVGMIWLYTYDVHVTNKYLTSAPGSHPKMHFTKPIGCVGQAGFDIALPLNFYLTADAKYIGCADVHAKLTGARVQTSLSPFGGGTGSVPVGPLSTMQHFRAFLYQITIGRTFWG